MSDMSGIWVVADQHNGQLEGVTLEILRKARELAGQMGQNLSVVLLGSGLQSLASSLGAFGADKVYVADHAELAGYRMETYGAVLSKLVAGNQPAALFFAATSHGRDLSSYVAAHLKAGVCADASDVRFEGGALKVLRPVFGGNAFATLTSKSGTPVIITVSAKAFEKAAPDAGKSAEVVAVAVEPAALTVRTQIKDFVEAVTGGKIDLGDAEIVVAGGRGVGGADHFKLLDDLARALGGAVGATRAVTDAGWRPVNEQIGQTGRTVKPKLYIAAGVSGAVQHWVGMKESGFIVAINTDAEAPIMKVADMAIVGDLFKVIPEMIQAINAAKGAAV